VPSPSKPKPAGGSARPAFSVLGDEPLSPLSRRLLQVAAGLSLLLVAVVANSLLHGGESPLALNPLNPVAAAAERTQDQPGARFTMKVLYSSEALGAPVLAHGGGAYNAGTGVSRARLHVPVPQQGTVELESVADDSSVYIRSPELAAKLPEGKEWLKVSPFLGQSEQTAMTGDGADNSVALMSIAHSVRPAGHETIKGERTTRYRVSIDFAEFANLLRAEGNDQLADEYKMIAGKLVGPVRGEAWIDDQGLLRRSRTVMTMTDSGGPAVTMDMQLDLFDFGAEPDIEVPDDDRVLDTTPLLEQQMDLGEAS
jgi:hypothetical protein